MKKIYIQTNGFMNSILSSMPLISNGLRVGLILLLLFFTPRTFAQDCGTGETLIWDTDQNISGVFTLAPEDILQIEPGVNIVFETTDSKLLIQGTILALGTEALPISFSGSQPDGWSGIDLIDACPSQFSYCNFSGINRGGAKMNGMRAVAGIEISGTDDVSFNHCQFTENNDGIVISGSTGVLIESCSFSNNEILPGQYGLITIQSSSSDTIRNCTFNGNKTNTAGLIGVISGSTAVIQNNAFNSTSFFNPIFNGTIFSVISLKQSTSPNLLIVNSNSFSGATVPQNNRLCEISIFGNQANIDFSTALIWNNSFIGYPFPFPGQPYKTAIRANYSVLTISHNDIKSYNRSGIEVLVSEAKINLNNFNVNNCLLSSIYLNEYLNYTGRVINNVIFANTFTNNSASNAPAILSAVLPNEDIITTISQNVFTGNEADGGKGGAIYDFYGSRLSIESNFFSQNSASAGGAICIETNNTDEIFATVIKDNTFAQNTSTDFGGAIFAGKNLITIENNVIEENEAPVGAGIFINGINSSSKKSVRSSTQIVDNLIKNNIYTQAGGGCYLLNCSDVQFTRNLLSGNSSPGAPSSQTGGGLYAVDCNLEVYNSHFVGNQAGTDLGAIYLSLNAQNSFVFQNCNVTAGNDAGGLVFGSAVTPANIDIYNSLFYENNQGATGKSIIYAGAEPITANNCFFDVLPSNYDVSFVDELVGNSPGWIGSGDYYLDCDNSICVDSGNSAPVYNDLPGAGPDEALFPSCGTLINDIGISGGPFALDIPELFQPGVFLEETEKRFVQQASQNKSSLSVINLTAGQVSVFPNPSNGVFSVALKNIQFEKATIIIANASGQVICQKQISGMENNIAFNLSDENKGVCFIHVHTGQQVITKKVILK